MFRKNNNRSTFDTKRLAQCSRISSVLIFWVILFAMFSCQTAPPSEPIVIPMKLQKIFVPCLSGDGAVNMQVYHENALIGSADLDWIANETGWQAELMDPLGGSILRLNFDNIRKQISSAGPLSSKLPKLSVDGEGFLTLDGEFSGVKLREMTCFLRGKLPVSWLAKTTAFQRDSQSVRLMFDDAQRLISTELELGDHGEVVKKCSKIQWSHLLGLFRTEVFLCLEVDVKAQGSLSGIDSYEVKWVNIE